MFDSFMKDQLFDRNTKDQYVYVRDAQTDKVAYLLLYVDDMLILSGNKKVIKKLKDWLNGKFEMKDMEHASRILGMDIRRDREKDTLTLSQDTFI